MNRFSIESEHICFSGQFREHISAVLMRRKCPVGIYIHLFKSYEIRLKSFDVFR